MVLRRCTRAGDWFQSARRPAIQRNTVDGVPLKHVVDHSPTGMNWGYNGSGPADLSLSVLADYLEDRELAYKHYQDFKFDRISTLPQEGPWTITGYEIEHWLKDRKGL